ncbi:MAG: J domain-containing protein [Alphaproteobacteria bacterium]
MKLDSKYFDSIRIKPDEDRVEDHTPLCEWPGCKNPGTHRAPKGRGHEGEYHLFCIDHVREYNKSYNYFSGMKDDDVAAYQKASVTGHRPTWSSGVNAWASTGFRSAAQPFMNGFNKDFETIDPLGLFGMSGHQQTNNTDGHDKPRRVIGNAERRSLRVLDLGDDATPAEIKARFKVLVKRHHPDGNGGDRTSEDTLREVIQAYNYLKQAGFC